MKRINLNKKNGIIIFLLIVGIGTTLAFFTSTVSIPNIFTSLKYETTTTTEDFTSPSNWKPGDVTPKTVITTNNSTVPIRVRIKVYESWVDKNNSSLPLSENNTLAAIINLDNRQDWIYDNGYYYYKYDVEPGDETNSFIKSVTFNKDIVGEYVCTTVGNTEQCDSASNTYQNATYNLDVSVETTPADNYLESWGLDHVPRRVAPTYCSYDGELEVGTEYVNGQYTYRYKQIQSSYNTWTDMDSDGWSVYLTDKESTDPVTSPLCTYINDIPITHTNYMFSLTKANYVDTSTFDTTKIKSMYFMLGESQMAAPQKEINIDLSNFETSNVINMDGLFSCLKGDNFDVSSFDTSNVESMEWMFYKSDLDKINISNWDTRNVKSMKYMFRDANIKSFDFSSFETDGVTDMDFMFYSSIGNDLLDLKSFDTSNVTSMKYMFFHNIAKTLDLSSFDTSNVISMLSMFSASNVDNLDLSNFNTSSVTSMTSMFSNCKAQSINLSSFDTSNVTTMLSMFSGSQVSELDLSSFDTSSVTSMRGMFYKSSNLNTIYVSNKWNTNSVNSSNDMFYGCTSLPGFDSTKIDASMANTNGGYLTLKTS